MRELLRPDFQILSTILIVMLLFVDRRVAPPPPWVEPTKTSASTAASDAHIQLAMTFDPDNGRSLFGQTCTACHGSQAQGLPHQGVDLRVSKFIAQQNDLQLVSFLKTGRQPKDPKSVRGLLMPARGGNPSLVDVELSDIVAYLRQVQKQASTRAPTSQPTLTSAQPLGITGSTEER